MQNENYLVHYGTLHMRWGIRRYQNPDGSLTPEGRIRYGVGKGREAKNGPLMSTTRVRNKTGSKGVGNIYSQSTMNTVNKANQTGVGGNYSNETLNALKKKGVGNTYASETTGLFDKKRIDDLLDKLTDNKKVTPDDEVYSLSRNMLLDRAKKDSANDKPAKKEPENQNETKGFSKEDNKKKAILGLEAIKKMSDADFQKLVTNKTDAELNELLTRVNKENNIRNKVKTSDDLAKEAAKKAYDTRQGKLSDAQSLANQTANLARGMKSLSLNKQPKKAFINPKKLNEMSNDEIIAATERARIVNNYLSASNQTVEKGRKAIDWDKIATIAGIAGTGLAMYSTIVSLKNRDNG